MSASSGPYSYMAARSCSVFVDLWTNLSCDDSCGPEAAAWIKALSSASSLTSLSWHYFVCLWAKLLWPIQFMSVSCWDITTSFWTFLEISDCFWCCVCVTGCVLSCLVSAPISSAVPQVLSWIRDVDHNEVTSFNDGYTVSRINWFKCWLQAVK